MNFTDPIRQTAVLGGSWPSLRNRDPYGLQADGGNERFNGKFRNECLGFKWFRTCTEAKVRSNKDGAPCRLVMQRWETTKIKDVYRFKTSLG